MSERTANLIGGASGIVSIVLVVIGLGFLVGVVPPAGGSGDDVATFLERSEVRVWTGAYIGLIGALLHLVFFGRLYGLLRRAEGGTGWLSMTAFAGAVIQFAVLFSADFAVSAAAFYQGRRGFDPDVLAAFFDVKQFAELISGGLAALFLAATAVVVLRMGALPRWLGWFAAATAVLLLLSRALGPTDESEPANFLAIIWVLAASIVLIVRRERLSEGRQAVPQGA
jgi:hypothetical protein